MEQQLFSTLDWAQTPDSRHTCLHLLWLCSGLCVSLWQPAVSLYAGTSHSFHATIPISRDRSVDVAGARRCKLLFRLNTFSCIIDKFWGDMGTVHPEFDVVGKDHLCDLSTWADNTKMSPKWEKCMRVSIEFKWLRMESSPALIKIFWFQ